MYYSFIQRVILIVILYIQYMQILLVGSLRSNKLVENLVENL